MGTCSDKGQVPFYNGKYSVEKMESGKWKVKNWCNQLYTKKP